MELNCNCFKVCDVNMFTSLYIKYCTILLSCQLHTDYNMVSAHDILIFEKCTDDYQQLAASVVQVWHTVDTDCNSAVV